MKIKAYVYFLLNDYNYIFGGDLVMNMFSLMTSSEVCFGYNIGQSFPITLHLGIQQQGRPIEKGDSTFTGKSWPNMTQAYTVNF